MNTNLLIVGAGTYGIVAKEIAESMNCFEKIAFVDDESTEAQNGINVIGALVDIEHLIVGYNNVIVAIGNPEVRLALLEMLGNLPCKIATLISPRAYISPSAKIATGTIIEPMAVIHTRARIEKGCFISAGAVVNHESVCEGGVHVDCNATVAGYTSVPAQTKIESGTVFSIT